jgi:hypothetical protein
MREKFLKKEKYKKEQLNYFNFKKENFIDRKYRFFFFEKKKFQLLLTISFLFLKCLF